MTKFSFVAFIQSLRCRGVSPGAIALLSLPWTAAGCADEGGIDAADELRAHFPEQQQLVIGAGDGFVRTEDGLTPRRTDDGARAVRQELRVVLPDDGSGALRFQLPGGFEARVTELGGSGEASILGTSVAYARAGGETAFWTATRDGGYEEWLYLPPAARSAGGPLASWRVEGAALRRRGDLVELLDAAGRPRVRVTAPAAYAAGGRPVEARLEVDGDRITLGVEGARGEPLLIDPLWTLASSMLSPREGHSATLLQDGRVLVVGGADDGGSCVTSAELYDPASDAWMPAASMGESRCWPEAILLADGRVLVAGGGPEERRSIEIYDPAADRWAQAAPMIDARETFPAVLLADGRVFVAGASRSGTRNAEVYDPVADMWTPAASMLHPRRYNSATLLLDGRVLVAGGHRVVWPERSPPTAEIYDPATDTWASAPDMNAAHGGHTAIRLPDGRVFLLDMDSLFMDMQLETYDPAAGTWTIGPGLTGYPFSFYGGPGGYATSLLGDGRVLATGGSTMDEGGCGTIVSCDDTLYWTLYDIVQVYDPATSVWSLLSPMQVVRSSHSSTVLPDGRVLIAGGRSAPGPSPVLPSEAFATATTEISSPMGTRGAPCANSAECAGAHCVDGVCCDRACEGACEACSVAAGAAQDGTCSPASGASCDDGDACTEADACQAGVCRGVPLDAGPCSGGSGDGGSGGDGGDTGEGGHAGSTGDGGSAGATSSTSAASSGSGGDTGEGGHAGSTGDGGSAGATTSTSTGSSGSGGDTGEGGHAGSTGDGGSAGATSSTSAASSGSGGESAGGFTACSASASVGSANASASLSAAWLAALGLLAWSRRRGAHLAAERGAPPPEAPSTMLS
ncbi:Kelch repeat-containing protein [Sorangium sp. So ce1078]|uniref:Kelch repeat-containing protein n=1 Tax=Sorangium sp. So ce1078 TaxID=3133329 RepID=UPI003F61B94C